MDDGFVCGLVTAGSFAINVLEPGKLGKKAVLLRPVAEPAGCGEISRDEGKSTEVTSIE
jgi:hypothetical protein